MDMEYDPDNVTTLINLVWRGGSAPSFVSFSLGSQVVLVFGLERIFYHAEGLLVCVKTITFYINSLQYECL